MGELYLPTQLQALVNRNKITPDDVINLRHYVFQDGVVSFEEAEALFAVDNACMEKCEEWIDFFLEAITDFLVYQAEPEGYISEDKSKWLMAAIDHDGYIDSLTELGLLIKVIDAAKKAPPKLSAYALRQVAHAVLEGEGPLAKGGKLERGVINADEVTLLRGILYAFGGGGNVGITMDEAEVLFDLNDKSQQDRNDPSWSDLFVKAIASCVMRASGYEAPNREIALELDARLNDTSVNLSPGRLLGRMFGGGFSNLFSVWEQATSMHDRIEQAHAKHNELFDMHARLAEKVDESEADWLASRIGRDGIFDENERQLISYLKKESPDIHPKLQPLLNKVA